MMHNIKKQIFHIPWSGLISSDPFWSDMMYASVHLKNHCYNHMVDDVVQYVEEPIKEIIHAEIKMEILESIWINDE